MEMGISSRSICRDLTGAGRAFLGGSIRSLFSSVVSILTLSFPGLSVFCAVAHEAAKKKAKKSVPDIVFNIDGQIKAIFRFCMDFNSVFIGEIQKEEKKISQTAIQILLQCWQP